MKYRPSTFPLLFISLACSQVQAAEERLEEMVITSSRVPVPLRQTATSVSVLTAENILAHGNLSLSEVLRQMPAIAASREGGPGQGTVMRIRGEEGFRTLTVMDGMRLSDPSSPQIAPHMGQLLSNGIGRVEVLRGPQGISYGADAGGVISISSSPAAEGIQSAVDLQSGAFGTQQFSASGSGSNGTADFSLSLTDFTTEGFNARVSDDQQPDDDGYDNTTLHVRTGLAVSDRLQLQLVHRDVSADTQFDGCWSGTTVHDCESRYSLSASRLALEYQGDSVQQQLSYAVTNTGRDSLALGQSVFATDGKLQRLEYIGSSDSLPAGMLVWGMDLEDAELDGDARRNTGVHLEYLGGFSDSVFVSAGVRHDDNDDFGSNASYRLSAAWLSDLADGSTVKLRSSLGSGFRAPSPYEISYNNGPFAYPPASLVSLQQETSRGWEAGIEYSGRQGLELQAVYFDQKVENAIYFDLSAFSGYLQETGTSISRGIELSGELALRSNLLLNFNYTWNSTEDAAGRQRLRRPEHLLNAGLSWQLLEQRLYLGSWLRAQADAIDESFGSVVSLDNFAVVDLSASYRYSEALTVYGRLENLLDKQYQEVTGYNSAERALYIGFRLGFFR